MKCLLKPFLAKPLGAKLPLVWAMLFGVLLMAPFVKSFSKADFDLNDAVKNSYYYEGIGDFKNAIAAMQPAAKHNADNFSVQLRMGYLFLTAGQLANAEFHYAAALKLAPKSISPALGLMRINNLSLKYGTTEEIAYRILKMDLHNYYANLYLAYALRQQTKFSLAISVCERMLDLYPSDVAFLSELALAQYADNQLDNLAMLLDRIFLLEPENVTAKELNYQLLQRAKP